jgi:hypothetical protein
LCPPPLCQLLGPASARSGLLEAAGFKVIQVPFVEFASLKDAKAKAAYVLTAVKAAAPGPKVRPYTSPELLPICMENTSGFFHVLRYPFRPTGLSKAELRHSLIHSRHASYW